MYSVVAYHAITYSLGITKRPLSRSFCIVQHFLLDEGKSVTIGGKDYTIGTATSDVETAIKTLTTAGDKMTLNGETYTYTTTGGTNSNESGWVKTDSTVQANATIDLKNDNLGISDGDKVTLSPTVGTTTSYTAAEMTDGVSKSDSSVINADKAIKLMKSALIDANNIGTTGEAATVTEGTYDSTTGVTFTINKGYAEVADKLSFSLHVGSDADMTNKITVDIETMNSSYLGIKGLDVNDDSGIKATYAVDATYKHK